MIGHRYLFAFPRNVQFYLLYQLLRADLTLVADEQVLPVAFRFVEQHEQIPVGLRRPVTRAREP